MRLQNPLADSNFCWQSPWGKKQQQKKKQIFVQLYAADFLGIRVEFGLNFVVSF